MILTAEPAARRYKRTFTGMTTIHCASEIVEVVELAAKGQKTQIYRVTSLVPYSEESFLSLLIGHRTHERLQAKAVEEKRLSELSRVYHDQKHLCRPKIVSSSHVLTCDVYGYTHLNQKPVPWTGYTKRNIARNQACCARTHASSLVIPGTTR